MVKFTILALNFKNNFKNSANSNKTSFLTMLKNKSNENELKIPQDDHNCEYFDDHNIKSEKTDQSERKKKRDTVDKAVDNKHIEYQQHNNNIENANRETSLKNATTFIDVVKSHNNANTNNTNRHQENDLNDNDDNDDYENDYDNNYDEFDEDPVNMDDETIDTANKKLNNLIANKNEEQPANDSKKLPILVSIELINDNNSKADGESSGNLEIASPNSSHAEKIHSSKSSTNLNKYFHLTNNSRKTSNILFNDYVLISAKTKFKNLLQTLYEQVDFKNKNNYRITDGFLKLKNWVRLYFLADFFLYIDFKCFIFSSQNIKGSNKFKQHKFNNSKSFSGSAQSSTNKKRN